MKIKKLKRKLHKFISDVLTDYSGKYIKSFPEFLFLLFLCLFAIFRVLFGVFVLVAIVVMFSGGFR
jgi:hypothetical protein